MVTQIVNLEAGAYILNFQYYYPFINANLKTLLIYFNDALIFS